MKKIIPDKNCDISRIQDSHDEGLEIIFIANDGNFIIHIDYKGISYGTQLYRGTAIYNHNVINNARAFIMNKYSEYLISKTLYDNICNLKELYEITNSIISYINNMYPLYVTDEKEKRNAE